MPQDEYKKAYEREKKARQVAESLLSQKSRELYDNVLHLQGVVEELKNTQAQLFHAEKMASIGTLAAGVAHEINNPIGFSHSNLSTLQDYVQSFVKLDNMIKNHHVLTHEDAFQILNEYNKTRDNLDLDFVKKDIEELLLDTLDGLNRVKEIVSNLKKISHKGTDEFKVCDVNEIIEDCLKMVNSELKYKLSVHKNLHDCPLVLGQQSELSQVFINMFINASHACNEGGILTIHTSSDDSHVVVEISDNGKGIDESSLDKIFDPFFTTKDIGKGTGLGLSVSHGIIEKHKGKIKVKSKLGEGTQFFIELPIYDENENRQAQD